MKRADIKAGQDYLHARGTDWMDRSYNAPLRVTVLSDEKVTAYSGYGRGTKVPFTVADGSVVEVAAHKGGSGVIVQTVNPDNPEANGRVWIARAADLRGEWEPTHAAWATRQREKREMQRQAAIAKADREDRIDRVTAHFKALGIDPGFIPKYGTGSGITVRLEAVETLLARCANVEALLADGKDAADG